MKLKLVVVSMSMLGLVSGHVYATTKHHHKHHPKKTLTHHVKHAPKPHVARHPISEPVAQTEMMTAETPSNDMNLLPPAPMVCAMSPAEMILNAATQNLGRALPNPCNPGWYNRIHVSGGVNVDMGKWGIRDADIQGENYKRVSINDAYLNIGADITSWANAFVSLSYSDPTKGKIISPYYMGLATMQNDGYSNVYTTDKLSLEQGYATIGNFDYTPFYIQIGKQFQDFGRYEIHPITRSLTQVMSETLVQSGKIGLIVPSGFHASLYGFDDPINKFNTTQKPFNYGFSVGYDWINDQLGFDFGGAYLYNLIAAGDVAHAVSLFHMDDIYNSRVGAMALYGDLNYGQFTLGARWVSTIQRFNFNDLPKNGWMDVDPISHLVLPGARGAKPWALGVQAGYTFDPYDRIHNIYVGYETSREAAALGLPRNRWLAGWDVEAWRNTNFGIEWNHDNSFTKDQGGNGKNTNLFSLRAAVKFG